MDIRLILLLKKTARERLTWLKTLAARHPYYGGMHRLYRSGVRPLPIFPNTQATSSANREASGEHIKHNRGYCQSVRAGTGKLFLPRS